MLFIIVYKSTTKTIPFLISISSKIELILNSTVLNTRNSKSVQSNPLVIQTDYRIMYHSESLCVECVSCMMLAIRQTIQPKMFGTKSL